MIKIIRKSEYNRITDDLSEAFYSNLSLERYIRELEQENELLHCEIEKLEKELNNG